MHMHLLEVDQASINKILLFCIFVLIFFIHVLGVCFRYGFVVYADPSVTDIACQGLNGLKMGDRVLTVRRATEVRFFFSFKLRTLYLEDSRQLWTGYKAGTR